jgi:hypothetical protein
VPRKVFVAGEILTAADVNANLADQAVMVFDNVAARTAAIPSPIEGMVTYLKDSDGLFSYSGTAWVPAANSASLGAGAILQVVSTTKTDPFTVSGGAAFADVTGFQVTITPRSAASKIYVSGHVTGSFGTNDPGGYALRLLRDSTEVGSGTPVGSREGAITVDNTGSDTGARSAARQTSGAFAFLDSPNTASAVTYKIQMRSSGASSTLNSSVTDGDNSTAQNSRSSSSITVMEVAG